MSTKLADLLIAVAEDPERLASFLADPEPEMDDAQLTDAEKAAIRDRDAERIERLTGGVPLGNWASALWIAAARALKPSRRQRSHTSRPTKPAARRRTPARGTRPGGTRKPKRGRSGRRGR